MIYLPLLTDTEHTLSSTLTNVFFVYLLIVETPDKHGAGKVVFQ